MSTNPFSSGIHELTIVPGGIVPVFAEGDFFYVVETNVDLQIMRSGAPLAPYQQGTGEQLPPGAMFDRLEVRNPSLSVPAKVRLYVGFGRYLNQRQAVYEPKTRVACRSGSLASLATLDLSPALAAGDLRRKEIVICNGSAELRLYWRNKTTGVAGGFILPGFSAALPVSEDLELYNPAGSALEYYVTEIFWTT